MSKPTKSEAANGWTEATLTKYIKQRNKAAAEVILYPGQVKPSVQNNQYNPHRKP